MVAYPQDKPLSEFNWQQKFSALAQSLINSAAARGERPRQIRRGVLKHIRLALDPDKKCAARTATFIGPDGKPETRDDALDGAGVFRLMLNNEPELADWRSPVRAESIMAVVQRHIDDDLARRFPQQT